VLSAAPQHTRHASEQPWVDTLRGLDDALWVNTASESERFLFYDARTRERPAITLARGRTTHRSDITRAAPRRRRAGIAIIA